MIHIVDGDWEEEHEKVAGKLELSHDHRGDGGGGHTNGHPSNPMLDFAGDGQLTEVLTSAYY